MNDRFCSRFHTTCSVFIAGHGCREQTTQQHGPSHKQPAVRCWWPRCKRRFQCSNLDCHLLQKEEKKEKTALCSTMACKDERLTRGRTYAGGHNEDKSSFLNLLPLNENLFMETLTRVYPRIVGLGVPLPPQHLSDKAATARHSGSRQRGLITPWQHSDCLGQKRRDCSIWSPLPHSAGASTLKNIKMSLKEYYNSSWCCTLEKILASEIINDRARPTRIILDVEYRNE